MEARRGVATYLLVSFGWTWLLWIGGWWLGDVRAAPVTPQMTLVDVWAMIGAVGFLPQLLFALGVFGPLLGYLAVGRYRPFWGRPTPETVFLATAVPVVTAVPAFVVTMASGIAVADVSASAAVGAVGVYFVSNLLTSGTEEFGWRGFLHPVLREHDATFWGAAWKGGLVWAVWHYPLMVMLYWQLGPVMVLTIGGFTASIVAMAWITALVYERSNSLALAALLHGLNNTAGFALVLLFPGTPFTVVSAVMAWVVVAVLERRYRVDAQPSSQGGSPSSA
ncbi:MULTISPECIES: CPBP family glutamic-type intramembrane protease [unclassified Nesterenkonia]|uniref:CPBP family glutamic-type intramembrane protease n=1 Tax=unclassified Nesterenkonia TaxID=2629769 RepID=UPI001F4D2FAF|nr:MULTISPECIES: CPBP family glutamic-type intramembrane protease [unclassified Nesterenkonia]MCH8560713.1 CPBP family glutamic-type intramembrane protease [Nesterenkonia sp. DZ6]MCH8570821.1 CPBP family glutamic-type intramembrane protease [Nesterenkonia sp. AY15]